MEPFVPPPYPHDRLAPLRDLAAAVPGGMVDLSIGDPCDPMPDTVVRALDAAVSAGVSYPPTIGTLRLREAASGWMRRRLGVDVEPSAVMACIGTKELVASLPHHLRLRDPSRDTVLYPAVAYPTYAMGAVLAGCRAVPVPLDDDWRLDLAAVSEADAERALLLWVNAPANPTGSVVDIDWMGEVARWGRERGVVVASDECYVEFVFDADGRPAAVGDPRRASILHVGPDGVLAVHSLSKRSNMAGMRAGFVAGDPALVHYLGEVRKHSGLMVPGPVQAAAVAALDDDTHADAQLRRYADRRAQFGAWVETSGLIDETGPGTFYLWLRDPSGADGWDLTRRLAAAGTLVSPGELYGEAGSGHVRIALVAPHDRLALAVERLAERFQPGDRPAVPSP